MKTALLLVDVQKDMLEPPNPVPSHVQVRKSIQSLLEKARNSESTIIHIQNDGPKGEPDEPYSEGWELDLPVREDEVILRKNKGNSFSNPELSGILLDKRIDRVVIAGMQSNYCVLDTCRGAIAERYKVVLASGAHATYDEKDRADIISKNVEVTLSKEGVEILPYTSINFN
jgi:streptothricin hydrolase